jgi:hypothetical protein
MNRGPVLIQIKRREFFFKKKHPSPAKSRREGPGKNQISAAGRAKRVMLIFTWGLTQQFGTETSFFTHTF